MFFLQIHFLRSILRRHHTDRIPDGLPAKVPVEQESLFMFKTSDRNGKNRNPKDSCRNRQPCLRVRLS